MHMPTINDTTLHLTPTANGTAEVKISFSPANGGSTPPSSQTQVPTNAADAAPPSILTCAAFTPGSTGYGADVTVRGTGFTPQTKVTLNSSPPDPSLSLGYVHILDATTLTFLIAGGLDEVHEAMVSVVNGTVVAKCPGTLKIGGTR